MGGGTGEVSLIRVGGESVQCAHLHMCFFWEREG